MYVHTIFGLDEIRNERRAPKIRGVTLNILQIHAHMHEVARLVVVLRMSDEKFFFHRDTSHTNTLSLIRAIQLIIDYARRKEGVT